jgi:hypothetical protein
MSQKMYRIDKLERGTRKLRSGQDQTGLWVTLFNISTDSAGKAQFLSDYHNADVISSLESIGETGRCHIKWDVNESNGRKFYNINGVTPAEDGPGAETQSSPPASSNSSSSAPPAQTKSSGGNQYRKPDELIRSDAIRQAKDVAVAMLAAPEYGKCFSKTKTTVQIVQDFIFEMADEIVAYVKGERVGNVDSSDADLDKGGVDAGEPGLPGDDD